jgi:hypothetical protein
VRGYIKNFIFLLDKTFHRDTIITTQQQRRKTMSVNNPYENNKNREQVRKWLADKIDYYANWLYLFDQITKWSGWLFLIISLVWTVYSTLSGVSNSRPSQQSAMMLSGLLTGFVTLFAWFAYEMWRSISFGVLWTLAAIEEWTRPSQLSDD